MSSAGRKRIALSPDFKTRTPRSKRPFQNSSRVFGSGRLKAMKRPRPRTADTIGSSRCNSCNDFRKCAPTLAAFATRFSSSMTWRKCVERTMSVKLPPQVELSRLGKRKALSFTSSRRGPAITPQTCAFFPNAIRSGTTPKCSQHQLRPVVPMPHCTSSKIRKHLVLVADAAQRLEPFAPEMIVAAFTLDRLDDDRRDVDPPLARRIS